MTTCRILICIALLAAISPAAMSEVSIHSMNYPAWVERGEQTIPVSPGNRLQVGDVLHTSDDGRAWLQVDGGSVIKLGKATRLAIDRTDYRGEGDDSLFVASFNLLQGTFRYAKRYFILQPPARHELEFNVGDATIEVDNSDVYARTVDDEAFVVLFEGRIAITSPDQPAVIMNRPLGLYRKAGSEPAGPISRIDEEMVDNLGAETELDPALGIAKAIGHRVLVLRSLANPVRIEEELGRFRQAGYAVRERVVEVDGQAYTRIQLEGLANGIAARNLRLRLIEAELIEDAWVGVSN